MYVIDCGWMVVLVYGCVCGVGMWIDVYIFARTQLFVPMCSVLFSIVPQLMHLVIGWPEHWFITYDRQQVAAPGLRQHQKLTNNLKCN